MFKVLRQLHDDRGSLPLAMLAAIIVTSLVVVMVSATLTGTRATRFDRSYTTVIQAADAGIQEATHRIVRGSLDPASPSGAGAIGDASYSWTATNVSPVEWEITSTGTMPDGTDRTVEATVKDEPRFFLAAFADRGLSFAGGNGADSYGTSGWYTGNGIVAGNEDIRLNGSSTTVDGVVLYNWDAYPDLSRCVHTGGSGCDDVRNTPEAIAPSARIGPPMQVGDQLDTAFIDEQLAACGTPLNSWTASVNGGVLGPPLTPEVFCVQDLIIDIETTVSAPVQIYVAGNVSIKNQRSVNCLAGCTAGASAPDSTDLQIYSSGGDVELGNHAKIAAAIYAPESNCKGNPSSAQAEVFGSLICGTITNQGGWQFHFDDELLSHGKGQFAVQDWREE
ncbi:MAG: hypothetical protein M3Q82_03120 [Actinomycetota bacterium]|jgi:hypothetical protein|nr:hypothetical protein [Actinomycetota bacterium]